MAHVQGVTLTGTSSGSTITFPAFGTAITSGNMVIGWLYLHNPSNNISNIQVGTTNATILKYNVAGGTYTVAVFYLFNITGGPTTITVHLSSTPAGTDHYINFDEFSGEASVNASSDAYTATAVTSFGTSLTTTAANCQMWTCCLGPSGPTAPSGYTKDATSGNAYATQATAGASGTLNWTFGSSPAYVALVALAPAQTVLAVGTYYIDNAIGNDTWSGTAPTGSGPTGPWATPGHLSSYAISGGTTVLLNSANPAFTSGFSLTGSNRGSSPVPSASAPVTLGSYGGSNATISISAAGTSAVSAVDWGGIIIQNITAIGPGATVSTADGVTVSNTTTSLLSFVQVLNVTVSGFGYRGIMVSSYPTLSVIDNVLVSGCVTHDNCGAAVINTTGIQAYGCTNVHITACTSYNNAGVAGLSNWSGSGILVNHAANTNGLNLTQADGTACGSLIEYSIAYNNGANSNYTGAGPGGFFMNDCATPVMQFCESYSNKSGGAMDGDGFDIELSTNGYMQFCYSHDNVGIGFLAYAYSGAVSSGTTIRFCISQHDGTANANAYIGGISISSDVASGLTGVSVYGNTVYASTAPAFTINGSNLASITGHVSNNILYTTGTNKLVRFGAAGNPSGFLFNGNDYYASGTWSADWSGTNYTNATPSIAFANWKSASGQETVNGGFITNPTLTNPGGGGTTNGYNPSLLSAYLLQTGSQMRGAGLNLNTSFSINPGKQDYFGVSIPNVVGAGGTGYSVGADNGPAAIPPGPSPRRMLFPMLVGWRSWVPLAAAWRLGKAVKDNQTISRRRLFGRR